MIRASLVQPFSVGLIAFRFAAQLSGFKRIRGTTRPFPLDVFVNADTTFSVTIVGSRSVKNSVDIVIYHRNPKPASTNKKIDLIDSFDGGDPICR